MFNTRSISSEVENTNNDFDSSIVEKLSTQSIFENCILVEEEKNFDNIISHNLAHALIDQEPEKFLLIYDKIPSDLSQTRINKIKEKSIEFSEQATAHFNAFCERINCEYKSNNSFATINHNHDQFDFHLEQTKTTTTTTTLLHSISNIKETNISTSLQRDNIVVVEEETASKSYNHTNNNSRMNENEFIKEKDSRDNVSNKITYNETFFNDESNASSSLVNPLINNNNINTTNHITCFEKTLYDSLVRDENEENENKLNKANSTVGSSICRDGYVTNQRYQMLKDNKRSEMQRTHCYDEVFPAKQEESENSTDDDDDDDEEFNQANNDGSASTSSTETLSKSVVIQMNDDDNDDDYMGKKKFESLIKRQEIENSKKSLVQVSNKYEQEKNLLEKFKNECRLGNDKTTESVIKAKEVLIKLDMASTSDRYSSILNSRANSNPSNMKSDFRKNPDEDDDDVDSDLYEDNDSQEDHYDPETKQYYRIKRNSSVSNASKTSLTTSVLPSSSTAKTSILPSTSSSIFPPSKSSLTNANPNSYDNDLLNSLVTKLADKHKDKLPQVNNSSAGKANTNSIQMNNYVYNVDDLINLKLNPCNNETKTTTTSSLSNKEEETAWNLDDTNKSKKNTNSSSSSTCSNESKVSSNLSASSLKPNNINRRSVEGNMDSHGSSLTNSSKQDDEDIDMDVDEESINEENVKTTNEKYTKAHSNPMKSSSGFSQTIGYSKLPSIHQTINELSHKLVDKELPNLNPKAKLPLATDLKGDPKISTSKTLATSLNEKSTSNSSNSIATTTPRSVMSDLNKTTTNSQNFASTTTPKIDDLITKNSNSSKNNNTSTGAYHQKYSNLVYDLNGQKNNSIKVSTDSSASTSKNNKRNKVKSNNNQSGNPNKASIEDQNIDSLLEYIEQKTKPKIKINGKNSKSNSGNNKKGTTPSSKQLVADYESEVESSPTKLPPPQVQLQAQATVSSVIPSSLPTSSQIDINDYYDDDLSALKASGYDSSDEYVMVKGRKHIKSNKKANELSNNNNANNNSNSYNKHQFQQQNEQKKSSNYAFKPKPTTNTNANPTKTFIKPSNPTNVSSTSSRPDEAKPINKSSFKQSNEALEVKQENQNVQINLDVFPPLVSVAPQITQTSITTITPTSLVEQTETQNVQPKTKLANPSQQSTSVIFLDELNTKTQLSKIGNNIKPETGAITAPTSVISTTTTTTTTQLTLPTKEELKKKFNSLSIKNEANTLNGIKFGFIDSSSSDETDRDEAPSSLAQPVVEPTNEIFQEEELTFFANEIKEENKPEIKQQALNESIDSSQPLTIPTKQLPVKKLNKLITSKHKSSSSSSKSSSKANYSSSSASALSGTHHHNHRTTTASSTTTTTSSSDEYEQKSIKNKKPNKKRQTLNKNKNSNVENVGENYTSNQDMSNEQTIQQQHYLESHDASIISSGGPIMMNMLPRGNLMQHSQQQLAPVFLNQQQQQQQPPPIYYYHQAPTAPNHINPAYLAAFYAAAANGYTMNYAPTAPRIGGTGTPNVAYPPPPMPYYPQHPQGLPYPIQGYYTQPVHPSQQPPPLNELTNVNTDPTNNNLYLVQQQQPHADTSSSSSPKSQTSSTNEPNNANSTISKNNEQSTNTTSTTQATTVSTTSSKSSTPTPIQSLSSQHETYSNQIIHINPDYSNQNYANMYAPAAMPVPTAYLTRGPYSYPFIAQPIDYIQHAGVNNIPPHPQMMPAHHQMYPPLESGLIQITYPPATPHHPQPVPPPTTQTPNLHHVSQHQPMPLPPSQPSQQLFIPVNSQHQLPPPPPPPPPSSYMQSENNVYRHDAIRKDSSSNEQPTKNKPPFANTNRYQRNTSTRNLNSNRGNYNNNYNQYHYTNNNNNANFHHQNNNNSNNINYQQYQPSNSFNSHHNQIVYAPQNSLNSNVNDQGPMPAPSEYKGDFNLDETASYVVKQWNNLKQPAQQPSASSSLAPLPPQPQTTITQQQ